VREPVGAVLTESEPECTDGSELLAREQHLVGHADEPVGIELENLGVPVPRRQPVEAGKFYARFAVGALAASDHRSVSIAVGRSGRDAARLHQHALEALELGRIAVPATDGRWCRPSP
jgi:hypothetical protein